MDISGNSLTSLEEASLTEARSLETLVLRHNMLSKIHSKAFIGLHHLTTLDLSFNEIEHINPRVLQPIERSLSNLILSGKFIFFYLFLIYFLSSNWGSFNFLKNIFLPYDKFYCDKCFF